MAQKDNLDQMKEAIERHAGIEAVDKIMVGRELIGKSTTPEEMAVWIRNAINRMDALLDSETRRQVMCDLGRNCATKNRRVVQAAVKRRKKHVSLEDYIESEIAKPQRGTRFEKDGDRLIQVYTPHSWSRPMRCYCGFINRLPKEINASITYCECGRAFAESVWSAVAEKPVKVEVLQSAISGANECRLAIYL